MATQWYVHIQVKYETIIKTLHTQQIVDPWGTVIGRCNDDHSPSLAIATIDLDYMKKIRTEMPVLNHRRTDVYPEIE